MIKLSFCQNDSHLGGSFWQKDSLITHILFELWLIMIFSPVVNFAQQALCAPLLPAACIFENNLFVFKEVSSENVVLIYGYDGALYGICN